MKRFCFECCEETNVHLDTKLSTGTYNGKEFTYTAELYRCERCGNEIHDDDLFSKNIKSSIELFQKQHNMLIAKDFKYIRETIYDLSVRALAALIGCSPATISKYENGVLQSWQHDYEFKSLLSPRNMKSLIATRSEELKPAELKKTEERLKCLLEAVKVEELLKGVESNLSLPTCIMGYKEIPPISVEQLEGFFILKGHILSSEGDYDYRVCNLKLQKLMYFSEGWYSAITESLLTHSDFEAWRHGPVIKSTYHKYKGYGAYTIPKDEVAYSTIEELNLHPTQLEVLQWVWDKYGHFDGKYLEEVTHKETPWIKARIGLEPSESSNRIIPKQDIREYFSKVYEVLNILNRQLLS